MTPSEQAAVRHVAALRERIRDLTRELELERDRRGRAVRNASRFHAMLLEERVKHLPKRAA